MSLRLEVMLCRRVLLSCCNGVGDLPIRDCRVLEQQRQEISFVSFCNASAEEKVSELLQTAVRLQ